MKAYYMLCISGGKNTEIIRDFYYFCKLDLIKKIIIKRTLKILWLTFVAVAATVFAGVLAIQLPQVQTLITEKVVSILSEKLDGEITLEKIHIKPFSTLVLKNVCIIDKDPVKDPCDPEAPQVDTFFRAGYIIARFSLEGLFKQEGFHLDKAVVRNAQMNLVLEDNPTGTCRRDSSTDNLSRIFKIQKKEPIQQPGEKEIFHIRKVEIDGMGFSMKNYKDEKTPYHGGINWNDLDIKDIDINVRELQFKGGIMSGIAESISFREKTGYEVERISGEASVGRGKTIVNDLHIKDLWSDIDLSLFMMSYANSLEFADFINKVKLDGEIRKGDLSFKTLSYFAPEMESNDLRAMISGNVSGPVSDLRFDNIHIALEGGEFSGRVNGSMKGLPEIESTVINARLSGLNMTTHGFSEFISSWMKGGSLDLGGYASGTNFLVDASAKGTLNDMEAWISMNSMIGGLDAKAKVTDILKADSPIGISGIFSTENLDIGRIAGLDIIHQTTVRTGLKAKIGKEGIASGSVTIDSLSVDRLNVNGYDYSAIRAAGTLSNDAFNGTIVSNDPALNFMFQGAFALSAKTSNAKYKFWALLGHADLNAMNIDKRGISKVSLHTKADFTRTRGGDIMGNIDVANIVLENDEGRHNIGNINLASHSNNDIFKIRLNSGFADGTYTGSASITEFVKDLGNITLRKETPALFRNPAYNWSGNEYNLDFTCHNIMDLLSFVMPGLYIDAGTSIKARIDNKGLLKASLTSPRLAFGEKYMKSLDVSLDNADDNLSGEVGCQEIRIGNLTLKDNSFQMFAEDNHIGLGYRYENSGDLTAQGEFIMHGDLSRTDDRLDLGINLLPSSVHMNSREWNIMPSSIDILGKELIVNSFELYSGEQKISMTGRTSQTVSDTLTLSLDRFDISILNPLIGQNLGIKGAVTGNIDLLTSRSGKKLFIDLLADSTHIAGKPLGTVMAECLWNEEFERFDIGIRNDLDGESNLDISGKYIPRSRMIEAIARIDRLHIGYAQPFIKDVFSEMDGYLSGQFTLEGPMENIDMYSEGMHLDEGMLRVAYTNVPYYADGTFHIDNSGVFFDDLSIKDRSTGSGIVTGSINWNKLKDITFDTRLKVNELEAINVNEKQADVFYGNVYATGNVSISGPVNSLLLDVEAVTVKPGQLHIPLSNTTSAGSSQNLLKFYEPEKVVHIDPYEQMISKLKKKEESKSSFDVKLSVNASSDVEAFIEIDKASGNVLSGQGNGKIDLEVGEESFSINGDYTLTGGSYKFVAMGLVTRDFEIQDGSSLTFNGDIMETALNIDAIYKTKVSLSTLLADTTSVSNRRTVECGIRITDKISNPRLDFSINIPDLDPMVKSRVESALSTEDKVQKQFLSILLSNSFLPDEQSGIFNNSTMLYSNVSEMLANQISNIFQKLDIPLDLGLNYQPTEKGNDTFDVAISTQLFNNRVSVNGSVGNKQYTSGTQSDVVGDLDIEIKLDRSGAFRLNLFSHSADSYTNYLDNSQRNGVGLTYQTEFNSLKQFFRNMFSSRKKRQEAKQAEEKSMLEGERVELKITDDNE